LGEKNALLKVFKMCNVSPLRIIIIYPKIRIYPDKTFPIFKRSIGPLEILVPFGFVEELRLINLGN